MLDRLLRTLGLRRHGVGLSHKLVGLHLANAGPRMRLRGKRRSALK